MCYDEYMKKVVKKGAAKNVKTSPKNDVGTQQILTAIKSFDLNLRSEMDVLKNDLRSEMHANYEMLAGQISHVHHRIDVLEVKVDKNHHAVMTSMDGMVKKYTDLDSEYVSMKAQSARATGWSVRVGEKVGIPFPA